MLIKALAAAAGNVGAGGGYSISNSLRFNDNDSAYLSRTLITPTSATKWTWSAWVKRGNIGSNQMLFTAGVDVDDYDYILLGSSNQLLVYHGVGGSTGGYVYTNAVLRDTSGWYHIVVKFDGSLSSSNRVTVYVNGVAQSLTVSTAWPSGGGYINTANAHAIGVRYRPPSSYDSYFDGYMAEVNFIDGQALTADDFGQIDATTGEWSPKKYSGTYGTNGFYLAFEDGAALGDDTSGNTNDWTPTNLASTDQMLDTPTNNFAVLNPLDSSATLSEGNLKTTLSSAVGSAQCYGTIAVSSGKWYMETTLNNFYYAGNGVAGISGFHDKTNRFGGSFSSGSSSWYASADGSNVALGFSGSAVGVIMNIAIDFDSGKLWIGRNGVWNGSGDPSTGANPDLTFTPSGTYYPYSEPYRDGVGYWLLTENFGQDSSFAGIHTRQGNTDENGIGDFYYEPPTGYLALCTDNLPEPTIVDSETQFNVVTYTGDGNTGRTVTGVGFQPDFVWLKERNNAAAHFLYDSVRGATLGIHTNLTDAEATYTDGLTSFDTDGFTVGSRSNNNGLGDTYVAWCWKASGTAVTNTDGSITSQVSANVDAGFSIVGYAGNGSAGTVGHGLSSAPEMIIVKSRNDVTNWPVYHVSTGNTGQTYLSAIDAFATSSVRWNNTSPTSSVFSLGTATNVNGSGYNFIAYCFHGVEGFSKFGSYTGNGSADGPFVYTGFRPAFVIVKCTNDAKNWVMYDSERTPVNQINTMLFSNSNGADYTASTIGIDFLSNGFKLRSTNTNTNASGGTYIYMAFAESPTKFSLGR